MKSTAFQQSQGLQIRLLSELESYEKQNKIRLRFAGVVLKAYREPKLTSFYISDGSATAQVTLVYRRIPAEYQLPGKGDSVQVLGFGYKKELGGTKKNMFSFLKVHASGIKKITPEEELELNIQAVEEYRQTRANRVKGIERLEPLIKMKTFEAPHQILELNTLIWTYCYYVFESNPDIQSYVFNAEMIRASKDGNQFLADTRVTKRCLEAAITKALQELAKLGFLTGKKNVQEQEKEPFFVIKKDLLRGIEKTFEDRIAEMKGSGVFIEQLTHYVNKKLSEHYNNSLVLFDWKFSQKVLLKLQSLNKIYKTSDKLIFPNIRT